MISLTGTGMSMHVCFLAEIATGGDVAAVVGIDPWSFWDSGEPWMLLAAQSIAVGVSQNTYTTQYIANPDNIRPLRLWQRKKFEQACVSVQR
jgi:hypothetical protein